MSYLSTHFAGEIESNAKTEEWKELASIFIIEKISYPYSVYC